MNDLQRIMEAAAYWVRPEYFIGMDAPIVYHVWDDKTDASVKAFQTGAEAGKHCHLLNTRAALEALMEPGEDTEIAGDLIVDGSHGDPTALEIWQAMLRHILDAK